MTPEAATDWWGLIDKAGLPGVLIFQIALGWWLAKKYLPVTLARWGEWIVAINDLNENLEKIKGCRDAQDDQ